MRVVWIRIAKWNWWKMGQILTILRRQNKHDLQKTGCEYERKVKDYVKIFALSNWKGRTAIMELLWLEQFFFCLFLFFYNCY